MYNFLRNRKDKKLIIGQYLPKEIADRMDLRRNSKESYLKKYIRPQK